MRNYRPTGSFLADAPWIYPAAKQFSPDKALKETAEKARGSNYDGLRNKFEDDFGVKNFNELSHISSQ